MTDAVFFARLTRASDALKGALADGRKRKARQARRRFGAALRGISLDGYVAWINRDADGFELVGADVWRERGITTAAALGALLDAEHARNMRKEAYFCPEEEESWED